MTLKLNPISGELDLVGSDGGGGSGVQLKLTGDTGGQITGGGGNNINLLGEAGQAFLQTIGTSVSNTIEFKLIEPAEDGELLIGNTATGEPSVGTLTAGAGISITNGNGSITINSTAPSALQGDTDSGSAMAVAGVMEFLGGTGINTAGGGNTITFNAAPAVPTSFVTDSGTAVPVSNILNVVGGTDVNTSAAADTLTVNITAPISIANGGTGVTSLTPYVLLAGGTTASSPIQSLAGTGTAGQLLTSNGAGMLPTFQNAPNVEDLGTALPAGAVVFSDGTNLAGDVNNLFWDDTNDKLGVGTNTPLVDLHVAGMVLNSMTSTGGGQHGLQVKADAAANGDVHAIDILQTTGAQTTPSNNAAVVVNVDRDDLVGGNVAGMQVLPTEGAGNVWGQWAGVGTNPILQQVGTFGNMDQALVNATNRLTEFTTRGSDITMFVANSDTVTIGDAAEFQALEFILDTPADGDGVQPTFEYSTGSGTWANFVPIDGTNGFRNSGVISWRDSNITAWAPGAGGDYLIRITRNNASLSTSPVEDLVQIAATTEYTWDTSGNVTVNNIDLSTALTVNNGGTGTSSFTPYAVVTGGTTATGPLQNVSGVGTSGQVLTSNGAGQLPSWQGAGGFSWEDVTATTKAMAVNMGYTANNASQVEFTLPATAAYGDIIRVAGKGAGGWKISENGSQTIHFGVLDSTGDGSGYLESTQQYDCVHLLCSVANTDWTVLSSIGNITVV